MGNRFRSFIMSKFLWILLGSLITILIVMIYSFATGYDKSLDSTLATQIVYKSESFMNYLSSDIYCYLDSSHGKRELYFGELPAKENAIEINVPSKARLYLYSSDENSIIVRYEPHTGINRNYKISGYGNFDKVLNAFYEHTDNEIFKPTT